MAEQAGSSIFSALYEVSASGLPSGVEYEKRLSSEPLP